MTLTKGHARNAAETPLDVRLADMSKFAADANGVPRTGVLGNPATPLVATTATMNLTVAAAEFVTSKGKADGVMNFTNDGTVDVPVTAAPVSNSRIDVLWVKHEDNTTGDAASLPIFGVTAGVAAGSPTKPAIPTGALELATLRIYSGTTSTAGGGTNVLTNTYQMTAARGGTVPVRNANELAAWTPADGSTAYQIDEDALLVRRDGAWTGASFKRLYVIDIPGADRSNLTALGSVALAAVPFASRTTVKLIGVIGNSGTPNSEFGVNITATAGTLTNIQSNQQVLCETVAKWYPYSNIAYLDRTANTAATLNTSFSAIPGNGWFKGQVEVTVYGPGEY